MPPQVTALSLGESGAPGSHARRPTMVRFPAKDRRLFIAALHRKWFVRLCEIIDDPQLADAPRFASHRSQAEHADELISGIEHEQPAFRGGVPRLGEHTDEVLRELGITLEARA